MKSITQYTTHAIYQSSYQELYISIHLSINQSINQFLTILKQYKLKQVKSLKLYRIYFHLFPFNSIELDYFPNTHFTNIHEVFVI